MLFQGIVKISAVHSLLSDILLKAFFLQADKVFNYNLHAKLKCVYSVTQTLIYYHRLLLCFYTMFVFKNLSTCKGNVYMLSHNREHICKTWYNNKNKIGHLHKAIYITNKNIFFWSLSFIFPGANCSIQIIHIIVSFQLVLIVVTSTSKFPS